jgi:hypothetical protein
MSAVSRKLAEPPHRTTGDLDELFLLLERYISAVSEFMANTDRLILGRR